MRRSVSRSVFGKSCTSLRMSRTRALLKAVDAWVQAYETPAQIAFAETDILELEDVALSKAEFAGSPLHLKSTKLILTKGKPNYNPKERMEMLTEIDRPPVKGVRIECIQSLQTHTFSQAPSDTTNLVDFICKKCESYNVLQCNRLVCQICGLRCKMQPRQSRGGEHAKRLC